MTAFKLGMRVKSVGHEFMTGVPNNALGTVALVAGANGKSIYPDPAKRMVFVKWNDALPRGVFKHELEKA